MPISFDDEFDEMILTTSLMSLTVFDAFDSGSDEFDETSSVTSVMASLATVVPFIYKSRTREMFPSQSDGLSSQHERMFR